MRCLSMANVPGKGNGPQHNLGQHLNRLKANRSPYTWGCLYSLPSQNRGAFAITDARFVDVEQDRSCIALVLISDMLQRNCSAHFSSSTWADQCTPGVMVNTLLETSS